TGRTAAHPFDTPRGIRYPGRVSASAPSDPDRTPRRSGEPMLLERIYDEDLAQASYLVGSQARGEALVVDPRRDIQVYLDLATHPHRPPHRSQHSTLLVLNIADEPAQFIYLV